MSRVHVSFKKIHDNSLQRYEVLCSDFNAELKDEVIGTLNINIERNSFTFHPTDTYKVTFCPPELFVESSGDMKIVEEKCEERDFYYASWSYFIYKEAIRILEKAN